MAKAHYCPGISWLHAYREKMTVDVEARTLHKEIRNRRFQHAVLLLHTLFEVLEITENLDGDSLRLQFKNHATRGDPVQQVNDYLKTLDQMRFQQLYDRAESNLSQQQQAQFQSSIRALLSWTREQEITALGSEALPNKLTGRIAYEDVPVDTIDRLPVLGDYIAHLGKELENESITEAVLRVSREAARNFVIEILKELNAKVVDSQYSIDGKVISAEQFSSAIAEEISSLTEDGALKLIAAMGSGKDTSSHHSAAFRVRQFISWANESQFVSFSGEDIKQRGGKPRLVTDKKPPRTPRPKKAETIKVKKTASPKKAADSKAKCEAKQKKLAEAASRKAAKQKEKREEAAKREEKRKAAAAKRETKLKRQQERLDRQKERDERRREREAERDRKRQERKKAQDKKAKDKAEKDAAKAAAALAKQQAEQAAAEAEKERRRKAEAAFQAKRDAERKHSRDRQTVEQKVASGLAAALQVLPSPHELEDQLPGCDSVDTRMLPYKFMAWRDLHIESRKRETLNRLMSYIFNRWLEVQDSEFVSHREVEADFIAEDKNVSLDLRRDRLKRKRLTLTLTYQLCFEGVTFTKQCEELVRDLELGELQIGAILNHCVHWIVTNGFGSK